MIDLNAKHIAIAVFVSSLMAGCGYTRLAGSSANRASHTPYYPPNLDVVYLSNDAEFDSFEGYITKNIGTRSVKTAFVLSENDRIRIYQALKELDISSYPEQLGFGAGLSRKSLRVRYENVLKYLSWEINQTNGDERLVRLKNLERVLDDVLFNNPSYQSLPPYEGPPRL